MKEKYDLLIVGNGFDLAHHLHTSYNDFYFVLKCAVQYSDWQQFNKMVCDNFEIDYSKRMGNRGLVVLAKSIRSNRDNFFVKYFVNYNKIFPTWNSFESELKNILIAFDYLLDNLSHKTSHGRGLFEIRNIQEHGKYEIYMKNLIGEWNDINFNADADYSKGWVNIRGINNFTIPVLDDWLIEYKNRVIDKLFSDFIEFTRYFSTFLNIFAEPESVSHATNIECKKIISFNYTSMAQRKYNLSDENTFYIHGRYFPVEYTEKLITDSIILGVDQTKFRNLKFTKFTKLDQRHKLKEEKKIYSFIDDSSSICVYGLSLDLLDKTTLSMIFSKAQSITIFAFDSDAHTQIYQNLIEILPDRNIDEDIEKGLISIRFCSEIPIMEFQN